MSDDRPNGPPCRDYDDRRRDDGDRSRDGSRGNRYDDDRGYYDERDDLTDDALAQHQAGLREYAPSRPPPPPPPGSRRPRSPDTVMDYKFAHRNYYERHGLKEVTPAWAWGGGGDGRGGDDRWEGYDRRGVNGERGGNGERKRTHRNETEMHIKRGVEKRKEWKRGEMEVDAKRGEFVRHGRRQR